MSGGQEPPDLFGLLKGLDVYFSQRVASARRKRDAQAMRGKQIKGVDMGALVAERMEYLRDEVRKALVYARNGGAL